MLLRNMMSARRRDASHERCQRMRSHVFMLSHEFVFVLMPPASACHTFLLIASLSHTQPRLSDARYAAAIYFRCDARLLTVYGDATLFRH